MMEDNPAMAIQNNVFGTRVIADLAVKYQTRKFVMISTDKAVNPTNVMGCSKRICEIYCQSLNKAIQDGEVKGVTQFVTTRFGNVLGSNGSVIPLFKEQIKKGGPVTVTHKDIIRYFMLIPEACRLVLEAGTMGHGGEIFVFDMGDPVRIADLAQRMIELSGAKTSRSNTRVCATARNSTRRCSTTRSRPSRPSTRRSRWLPSANTPTSWRARTKWTSTTSPCSMTTWRS